MTDHCSIPFSFLFSFKFASCGLYFPVELFKSLKIQTLWMWIDHHHCLSSVFKISLGKKNSVFICTIPSLRRMGCAGSSQTKAKGGVNRIKKPRSWKHPQPITISQLIQLRDEFWDTAPHYGGRKEIWDALRAAAEADPKHAQVIVKSAGIILQNPDMTVCFDERGARYELPKYVLSEPKNLIRNS